VELCVIGGERSTNGTTAGEPDYPIKNKCWFMIMRMSPQPPRLRSEVGIAPSIYLARERLFSTPFERSMHARLPLPVCER